jgi:hypothetical protein
VNGARPACRRSVLVREAISAATPELDPAAPAGAASAPVGLAGEEHPPPRTSRQTKAKRPERTAMPGDRARPGPRARVEFPVISGYE